MKTEAIRKRKRVPLAASVKVTFEEGGETISLSGMTADISHSGMGLYVPGQIKKDTSVSSNINFIASAGILKAETLKGKVVFTEFIRDTFFTGIQFNKELSPDPEREPILYERIQNILKS